MLKYSIKRILLAFITAFIILTLTFFLVKLQGLDKAASSRISENFAYYNAQRIYGNIEMYTEPIEGRKIFDMLVFNNNGIETVYYYYEVPITKQYIRWLGKVVTEWDWGKSAVIEPNSPAINIIAQRLPVSVSVNIVAVFVSVPLGILLGIFAVLKKNTWIDHTISTLVMVFISVPSFVIIIFLIYLLGYNGNLPSMWPTPDQPTSVKVLAYIIPVMSLSFGSICGYTRFVRAELCEVMSSEYLLLARTKGLTKNQAITRHALRNAFVPILPSILAEFIGVFSGSMILERLYQIPGIGDLYIRAVNRNKPDYNVLLVDMAIFTIVGLLAGIVLDLSYGFIDPRIRMGEKNG